MATIHKRVCASETLTYLSIELSATIALMHNLIYICGKGHSNIKYPQQKYVYILLVSRNEREADKTFVDCECQQNVFYQQQAW